MAYGYKHFEAMRSIGNHAAHCLHDLNDIIVPGKTAFDIENYVIRYALKYDIKSAQFGYKIGKINFPAYCCVSINNEVCHGIPSNRILQEGDIVKVDVTFKDKDNWHGDACHTYLMGDNNPHMHLCRVASMALDKGIDEVAIENRIGAIGKAIETYVISQGFKVIQDFMGHAIGKTMHGKYSVPLSYMPNHPDSKKIIKPGMMFTIEPMIASCSRTLILENNWTAITVDGSMSAQFEHTLGVDKHGEIVIFTKL